MADDEQQVNRPTTVERLRVVAADPADLLQVCPGPSDSAARVVDLVARGEPVPSELVRAVIDAGGELGVRLVRQSALAEADESGTLDAVIEIAFVLIAIADRAEAGSDAQPRTKRKP